MARTDKEVFDHLCNPNDLVGEEIGLLSYAIYAQEKYEWVNEHVQSGSAPAKLDIARWISDITPTRFAKMKEAAAQLFDEAAHRYLQPQIEVEKEEAVRKSILAEVKAAGSFSRQLILAIITAVLTPLIIGIVIVSALAYSKYAPTPNDLSNGSMLHHESKESGSSH